MASTHRLRNVKKPRNLVVLVMLLSRKGGAMKDRRAKREGERKRKSVSEQLESAQ